MTHLFRAVAMASLLALLAHPVAAARSPSTGSEPAAPAAPDFNTPAAQLRVTLNRVLGEHAFLLAETMRAGLAEDASFAAAGAAVEANSAELEQLITDVYGQDAGAAFGETWRSHVSYLVDYTRALAQDDESAQALAQQQLHDYAGELGALFASVNPNLPASSVEQLVGEHVQQLQAIADFDSGNYADAYPAVQDTYAHMFDIGDALSEAIAVQFPDEFEGKSLAFSPAVDLRITLDRLLGEHTMLAIVVTRANVSGVGEADAAAAALDSNTDSLTSAVAEIYGDAAARAFGDLWRAHTDAYVAYVRGTLDQDEQARQAAIDDLNQYRADFSAFLADANPELSAPELRSLLQHHTRQLTDQVDAFASGDYEGAYLVTREAFAHAFDLGDALALAIAAQFPEMFPDAAQRDASPGPVLSGWLLLLSEWLLALGRWGKSSATAVERPPDVHRRRA